MAAAAVLAAVKGLGQHWVGQFSPPLHELAQKCSSVLGGAMFLAMNAD